MLLREVTNNTNQFHNFVSYSLTLVVKNEFQAEFFFQFQLTETYRNAKRLRTNDAH